MDFVVVGFGLGALAVLLGIALRDGGTRRWRAGADRALPAAEVARRVARGRACRAGGRVLALGGGTASVATLLALVAGAGDRTGAALVLAALLLAFAAALAWSFAYAHRYHPRPPRRRASRQQAPRPMPRTNEQPLGPVPGSATDLAAPPPPSASTATAGPGPGDEAAPGSPVETAAHEREPVSPAPVGGAPWSPAADLPAFPFGQDADAAVDAPTGTVDGSPSGDAPRGDAMASWRDVGDEGEATTRRAGAFAHAGKGP